MAEHEHEVVADPFAEFRPRSMPTAFTAELVSSDHGDQIEVTFYSANGSWTVFFERANAIAHAQQLLGLAYAPPLAAPVAAGPDGDESGEQDDAITA